MKYKNAIISTGKDILIVFICFFIFMFLSCSTFHFGIYFYIVNINVFL